MPTHAKRLALTVAFLVAAPGCFLLSYQGGTPERPVVTSFEIEGTKAISAKELKEHLATQASSHPPPSFMPRTQLFDPDAFTNDQRRIVRYYQARGYYQAKVEAAEVTPDGKDAVKIRVEVSEGTPTKVASVEVEGLDAAPEARDALGRAPLKKGDVFTEAAYDAMRAAIRTALANTGWPKAEVEQHAQVDPALNEAHVTYTVKPGERYRFGSVFVAGASTVPRPRIREEAQSVIEPGATYDESDLAKAQRRVFDLGVFGGVRVTPGPADDRKGTVPVVVSVREAPFRTIRAGPGFSLQANTRWQADAVASWSHRNWLGGLRKLNLDARVGYAWLPTFINAEKQGLVALTRADFTQPHVGARFIDFNIRLELERGLEQAYSFWSERARFGFPFRFGRLVTFTPSVNFELYQLSNPVSSFSGTTGNTSSVLQLATCPGQDPNLCLLSYFEQLVYVDLRDDPINTTRGFYFGVSLQEGFRIGSNGAAYLRFLPEVRAFANFSGGFVGAFRARVGLISPIGAEGTESLPQVALFTSGGPSQMRGYYTRQLAPVVEVCPSGKSVPYSADAQNACSVTPDYVPIGGAGLIDGSFELRFPLSGSIGGAAYLDFGNVRYKLADAFRFADLQYAVGLGLRYNTVLGPIRIDVAYRLPKPGTGQPGVEIFRLCPKDNTENCPPGKAGPAELPPGTQSTLVPIGREHHPPFISVHLSIGEAF